MPVFKPQLYDLIGLVCGLGFGRDTWKVLSVLAFLIMNITIHCIQQIF